MGMSKLNVLRCINIPWEFLRINGNGYIKYEKYWECTGESKHFKFLRLSFKQTSRRGYFNKMSQLGTSEKL